MRSMYRRVDGRGMRGTDMVNYSLLIFPNSVIL